MRLATEATISHCDAVINGIIAVPEHERTFGNTFVPHAQMESDWEAIYGGLDIYTTLDDATLTEAADANIKKFEEFDRELSSNRDLYKAFVSYKKTAKEEKQWEKLSSEDRKYINKVLETYKRGGIEQSDEVKEKLNAIDREITELRDQWDENQKKATEEMAAAETIATVDELQGVPEDVMSTLAEVDGDEKKRKVAFWDAADVLVFAKNETLRHRLIEMRDVGEENLPILGKIIEKSQESAKLNGYDTFTQERLDPLMVKTPEIGRAHV